MKHTVPSWSFSFFLFIMGVLFFITPVAGVAGMGASFFKFGFITLSIASIYIVSNQFYLALCAVILSIPGLTTTFATDSFDYTNAEVMGLLSNLLLYGLVLIKITQYVISQKNIDRNIIIGSICIYLLLGLIWSFVYMLIELVYPHSFSGIYGTESISVSSISEVFSQLFYYSYVTLTTLGYGSISPQSIIASSLASMEAIVGQLFIAIFIARLVGLHTAQELQRNRNQ